MSEPHECSRHPKDLLATVERYAEEIRALQGKLREAQKPRVVSREEIRKVLQDTYGSALIERESTLIDNLLALLNEPSKKEWCEHCKLDSSVSHPKNMYWVFNGISSMFENWDICPVSGCHAPRPKAE